VQLISYVVRHDVAAVRRPFPGLTPRAFPRVPRLTSLRPRSGYAFMRSPRHRELRLDDLQPVLRPREPTTNLPSPNGCNSDVSLVRSHDALRERATFPPSQASRPLERSDLRDPQAANSDQRLVRRVGRFHSSSTLPRDDVTALLAATPATISHVFTRMVRPSDELGHRSYPRLLPEGTAAFHRDPAAPC
jgi:hypothetical protein